MASRVLTAAEAARLLTPLERTVVTLAGTYGPEEVTERMSHMGRRSYLEFYGSDPVHLAVRPNGPALTEEEIGAALESGMRKLAGAAEQRRRRAEIEAAEGGAVNGKRVTLPAVTRSSIEEGEMSELSGFRGKVIADARAARAEILTRMEPLRAELAEVDDVLRACGVDPVQEEVAEALVSAPAPAAPERVGVRRHGAPVVHDMSHLPAAVQMMPSAKRVGGNPSQLEDAARGQLRMVRVIQGAGTAVSAELEEAVGLPRSRINEYLRMLAEADPPLIKNVGRRLPASRDVGKLAEEWAATEACPAPDGAPTLEKVRDVVCSKDPLARFTVGQVCLELGTGDREGVTAHFATLYRMGVLDPTALGAETYCYIPPSRQPVSRDRKLPPELEAARANGHTGRERGQVPNERTAWTNNKEVNALLAQAKADGATVEKTASNHVRVRYPNATTVRVSSTPDPSAIGLIEQDLNHAREGRGDLISQGGGPRVPAGG